MIKLVSEDLEFMKFEQVFNKIINEMKYINGENAVYKIKDIVSNYIGEMTLWFLDNLSTIYCGCIHLI